MRYKITFILFLFTILSFGQYPFEKFPSPKYNEYKNWKLYDWTKTKHTINYTITIPKFFKNKENLTIQLTSFSNNPKKQSIIRIFRNKNQIQKFTEKMSFTKLNISEPIRIADINGDGLKDIKIIIPYQGNGIASLNVKVIYLFQTQKKKFIKISFSDMMIENRPERDFDQNGNFKIITMNLSNYKNHNYWTFNIFEYQNEKLVNVNRKYNYPILIQFLYKKNYKITDKIDREKMKNFEMKLPNDYEIKK